ncbi:MAG: biotin-dependent carboxyltransferase family protein [Candidatus Puniceispirillaceae bacterium]
MTMLTILTAGPYTCIQDKGRTGYQALGVPEGGAVDPDARITANWLVSQPPETAGFEIFMGGFSFETDTALAIALSGSLSDQLTITPAFGNARTEPAGQTIWLQPGDQVLVSPLRGSNLAFLSVSANFDLPPVFGSVGTSPNARIGGLDGGMLRAGDRLPLRAITPAPKQRQLQAECTRLFEPRTIFRLVLGPQDFCFESDQIEKLTSSDWKLTTRMDRMGLRLSGPSLTHKINADILSDGIVKGAVQIPGDGQPIILMADHQTTGGYTKIASVISTDLPALTRLAAHRSIRFTIVSQAEAEQLARQKAALLSKVLPMEYH